MAIAGIFLLFDVSTAVQIYVSYIYIQFMIVFPYRFFPRFSIVDCRKQDVKTEIFLSLASCLRSLAIIGDWSGMNIRGVSIYANCLRSSHRKLFVIVCDGVTWIWKLGFWSNFLSCLLIRFSVSSKALVSTVHHLKKIHSELYLPSHSLNTFFPFV